MFLIFQVNGEEERLSGIKQRVVLFYLLFRHLHLVKALIPFFLPYN